MSFDLQLAGRRALVTGGTRGVGAAVVQGLHDAGVQVIAVARSVPADAIEDVRYVAADLSTAAGAAEAVGYPLLTAAIRAGCRVAIELSKRI